SSGETKRAAAAPRAARSPPPVLPGRARRATSLCPAPLPGGGLLAAPAARCGPRSRRCATANPLRGRPHGSCRSAVLLERTPLEQGLVPLDGSPKSPQLRDKAPAGEHGRSARSPPSDPCSPRQGPSTDNDTGPAAFL